jgi:hypothetical protein
MTVKDHSPEPNDKPKSRLEAEIMEIMERADREPTSIEKARGSLQKARVSAPGMIDRQSRRWTGRLTGLGLLLAAAVLAVLSFVLDDRSALLGRMLAFAALLAFIAFFAKAFMAARTGQSEHKRWRGRDFGDDYSPQDAWKDRFRK